MKKLSEPSPVSDKMLTEIKSILSNLSISSSSSS